MKYWLLLLPLHLTFLQSYEDLQPKHTIVTATKKIPLQEFHGAHNPSLIALEEGFLLTFRYIPHPVQEPWISYIGVQLLDSSFDPLGKPQLLDTRKKNSKTPSQAEDARVFSYRGRLFLIYNDNIEVTNPTFQDRRDMFIAELFHENGEFFLSTPLKLVYEAKYKSQLWQKNWIPFEWNGRLMLTYTLNPHEVLFLNFRDGMCYQSYDTWFPASWKWGALRGSTPPLEVDGEYLAFFHSSIKTDSPLAPRRNRMDYFDQWHYFMGAYTFSKEPPFAITKISDAPIIGDGFYSGKFYTKKVIFPGGFVIVGDRIYVAYGKDDHEVWIATLDKEALFKSMVPIAQ